MPALALILGAYLSPEEKVRKTEDKFKDIADPEL